MKSHSNSQFEEQYKRLNSSQKQAVDTLEGPVMVIAGPGTGKTTILTLRIAQILLKTDTPPGGILAITFTDAGVKAMKAKLRTLLGSRADEVKLYTFHGLASAVIGEFKDHFTHLDGLRQMTDIDAEALLRKILSDSHFSPLRPLGNPDFYITHILSGMRDAKRDALSASEIKEYAQKQIVYIQNDEDSISTRGKSKGELKAEAKKEIEKCEKTILFTEVFDLYEAKKKAMKLMDFDDLIAELINALKTDELLLQLLQEKFLYILVDEHQDTNDSQNLIVKMIADFFPNPNVFIVGDEKQAIYRFQGASVENFLRFQKTWEGIQTIFLENNYRSHQHILDAGFSMIENNYEEGEHTHLRVKLKGKDAEKPVAVIDANTVDAGERFMVKEIKQIMEADSKATVALITKNNRDVDRLIALCESHGIPVSAERSIDIFSHPIGIIFFALIEFLLDHSNTEALGKTITGRLWGLSFEDGIQALKGLRSGLYPTLKGLTDIEKEMHQDSPVLFLMHVAECSGFTELISTEPAYVEVWRAIIELASSIARDHGLGDAHLLLEKLVAYKTSAEQKSVKINIGQPDVPVKVMTAHGSKGLEFDHVFIPYATEESWSSRPRNSYFVLPTETLMKEGDNIRDTRRLFYVALTRARRHVTLIIPREDAGGKLLTPLRFTDEIQADTIARTTIESVQDTELRKVYKVSKDTKILDHTKRTLLEKGLSVTALNHFLSCSSDFIYKSILKIPEAPSATSEKGIIMHAALAKVWGEKNRSGERIEAIIRETIETHLKDSLLYTFEKETIAKELIKHAPQVASSLETHFAQEGEVHAEEWSEFHFEGMYNGEPITIPIHGKLDVVLVEDYIVKVFDYKTRGKMSVNEIKGDTKSSDGKYFRQLAFYKLLLASKHKGKDILSSLVFLTPDAKGECHIETLPVAESDIATLKAEIQLLIDAVWSGKVMEGWCEDSKCQSCALKRII